jgi:hypothetical protein
MSEIICEEEEEEKTSETLDEIIQVLQKRKLREEDLVVLYGNLGYSIGVSMEGIDPQNAPGLEELQKQYHLKPTVGVAMMLQGIIISSWYSDVAKNRENKENKV